MSGDQLRGGMFWVVNGFWPTRPLKMPYTYSLTIRNLEKQSVLLQDP